MGTNAELPKVSDRYSAEETARFRALGYWRDRTTPMVLDEWADRIPDAPFITDGTTSLTYGELRGRAYRFASALRAEGIERGDRVAVQLPNWSEFAVAALGLSRIGAIIVPIMPIYRTDEVGYVLAHSGARAVVTAATFRRFDYLEMYRGLRGDCPDLARVIVVRGEPDDAGLSFDDLVRPDLGAAAPPAADLGDGPTADDGLFIIYTSGTESRPKGCLHTYNTMLFTSQTMQAYHGWTRADVAFGPSPLAHATGYNTSLLIPLLAGAATHVMDVWEPLDGLDRIRRFGCTITTTATAFLRMLVDAYRPDQHDAGSMRVWVAAGSPIPEPVVTAARRILPTCEVLSLYGRTENQVTTLCRTGEDPVRVVSSDGRAPEGVEVSIRDRNGEPVPAGEEGDIAYRGPGHMLGYFRNPELTSAMFTADGFSRSGDLGHMDADGYVRVTGRLKEIIIRGGMNISARELEDHLLAHPDVTDVAVVAMPDERLGERVCAFVVPVPGVALSLEQVTAFLRAEGIATQKLPERLELVDQLPTTPTGKVQKHLLRDRVRELVAHEAGPA